MFATPENAGEVLDRAGALVESERAALLPEYFRHVAPEDLVERSPEQLAGAFSSHLATAQRREPRTASVRVALAGADDCWAVAGRSLVEVVTDDMPFLVDSVSMELARQGRGVHLVVHPRMLVRRDADGRLLEVSPADPETPGRPQPRDDDAVVESWMHVEVDPVVDDDDAEALRAELLRALTDVRRAVEDWPRMRSRMLEVIEELRRRPPISDVDEVRVARQLLEWIADDHFTFLGAREYLLDDGDDGEMVLVAVPGSGLGVLRDEPEQPTSTQLKGVSREKAREKTVLVLTKANSRATVHRPTYLDYVGVKQFDADGEVVGERRFLGLWSSTAWTESVLRIPSLREKVDEVLRLVGADPHSHAGKALVDVLETYPRDEFFHTTAAELAPVVERAVQAGQRRQLRAFLRRDTYGRYVSVIIHLPRDRYTTAVRERFAEVLRTRLGGGEVEFSARVNESQTARVHFVVHPLPGEVIGPVDAQGVEAALNQACRSWRDDLAVALVNAHDTTTGSRMARTWSDAFPEGYKEAYSAHAAAEDLGRIEAIGGEGIDLHLVRGDGPTDPGLARLKVYRVGSPLSLSWVLPVLQSMGVEVVDERPFPLVGQGRTAYVYEFGLRHPVDLPYATGELFTEALRAAWDGRTEVDGFNALVLDAGLTHRQVSVLRAYAKYLRQGNSPFALTSTVGALRAEVGITRALVRLFETRFDPSFAEDEWARASTETAIRDELEEMLQKVASLDHDRILRGYVAAVQATLRTNHFRTAEDGSPLDYLSLKLAPDQLPGLPEPRPKFEVFVHSPRVEGVHLRFGSVARGGLRWSDRRDDYRTEVLGLVKAQMVKNTVIVPVGAKGGFVAKQLPDPSDRKAWLDEGIASYRTFIAGLLDVTDNLVDGKTVPPPDVVRHDEDDAYLVVAADKGTASFSDIANEVAAEYDFWLGDAFASGGSVGYDHKGMGITARGAWVSVQRHFREMGVDVQSQEFTCVGIGDMSGDVFGNGLLCSDRTRLVAAFDHRDIFVDPTPDAERSYAERRRLFDLPRSSWQDYDTSLISAGGGVFSRSAKTVPVSPEMRRALGLDDDVTTLAPAELIRAVLAAPVDLLWNGGIGTYVKASTESHIDVGDKANDAIRLNGADLRVRVVGEGGNLGVTQLGRVELARTVRARGRDALAPEGQGRESRGRVNTDFIDNSAGVDTSDHEVNIKILLDAVAASGELDREARNELLASMTDEVGQLVLRDNYEQNLALANSEATSPALLRVHEDWMRALEERGVLHRELEGLPSRTEVRRRREVGEGLSAPELAVLLSWTKIVLADELIASDVPDDPYLRGDLISYFPIPLRQEHRGEMVAHPLHREIVTTQVVNELVNRAGITYWYRLAAETGSGVAEITRANLVARELFGAADLHRAITELDHRVPAELVTALRIELRTLVERASRWLLTRPHVAEQGAEQVVDTLSVPVQRLMSHLPSLLVGREAEAFAARRDDYIGGGVPEAIAVRVAALPPAYQLLDVVATAQRHDLETAQVAGVHLALGERLGLPDLLRRVVALARGDRWEAAARAALRDDLHRAHAGLTEQVVTTTSADEADTERVAAWESVRTEDVQKLVRMLTEIAAEDRPDLSRASVGVRAVRSLLD